MRISSPLLLAIGLLGAGCSSKTADPVAAAPDADRIDCAIGGAATFTRDCSAERVAGASDELVLHHRDGGFRRLRVGEDGRVTAADGAQPAVVTTTDGGIEVATGGDRYRLPATMAGAAQ